MSETMLEVSQSFILWSTLHVEGQSSRSSYFIGVAPLLCYSAPHVTTATAMQYITLHTCNKNCINLAKKTILKELGCSFKIAASNNAQGSHIYARCKHYIHGTRYINIYIARHGFGQPDRQRNQPFIYIDIYIYIYKRIKRPVVRPKP